MARELKVTRLANALNEVREAIALVKKQHLEALEVQETEIEEQLLQELHEKRISTLKVGGYNFIRAQKTSYRITDQVKALEWAQSHLGVIKVDTSAAGRILAREVDVPDGFERQDTEYLSVRKAAEEGSELNNN